MIPIDEARFAFHVVHNYERRYGFTACVHTVTTPKYSIQETFTNPDSQKIRSLQVSASTSLTELLRTSGPNKSGKRLAASVFQSRCNIILCRSAVASRVISGAENKSSCAIDITTTSNSRMNLSIGWLKIDSIAACNSVSLCSSYT
jgi:hypothetical protein